MPSHTTWWAAANAYPDLSVYGQYTAKTEHDCMALAGVTNRILTSVFFTHLYETKILFACLFNWYATHLACTISLKQIPKFNSTPASELHYVIQPRNVLLFPFFLSFYLLWDSSELHHDLPRFLTGVLKWAMWDSVLQHNTKRSSCIIQSHRAVCLLIKHPC